MRVDRVAGEAAAEVVVDAARRHGVERRGDHRRASSAPPLWAWARSTSSRLIGCGNFGRPAEAAPLAVELRRAARRRRRRAARGRGSVSPSGSSMTERSSGLDADSWSACWSSSSRRLRQASSTAAQQLDEPRPTVRGALREVGAAEERPAVGRQEHRHRPAALAGHGLHRVHVDGVDVGPLLAVDLDVTNSSFMTAATSCVLERLVGHHVAPVAGRVADRQQDRLVLARGPGERLVAPRVPVDGVVGVLAEVGLVSSARRFMGEPTGRADAGRGVGLVRLGSSRRRPRRVSRHGAPTGRQGGAGHRRVEGHRQGHRRRRSRRPAPR